jgi:phosphoglycolate phosphatase
VPAIGVGWGYAEPGELAAARLVVPDLDALLGILTGDDAGIWMHPSGRAHP